MNSAKLHISDTNDPDVRAIDIGEYTRTEDSDPQECGLVFPAQVFAVDTKVHALEYAGQTVPLTHNGEPVLVEAGQRITPGLKKRPSKYWGGYNLESAGVVGEDQNNTTPPCVPVAATEEAFAGGGVLAPPDPYHVTTTAANVLDPVAEVNPIPDEDFDDDEDEFDDDDDWDDYEDDWDDEDEDW